MNKLLDINSHIIFFNSLTEDLKSILCKYKLNNVIDNGYPFANYLNSSLLQKLNLEQAIQNDIEKLDRLTRIYKTSNSITLFRGCETSQIDSHISGDILNYPAYMSTSLSKENISKFVGTGSDGILLCISIPKGSYVTPMDGMPGETGDELEILLPRMLNFQIINSEIIKEKKQIEHHLGVHAYSTSVLRLLSLELISKVA